MYNQAAPDLHPFGNLPRKGIDSSLSAKSVDAGQPANDFRKDALIIMLSTREEMIINHNQQGNRAHPEELSAIADEILRSGNMGEVMNSLARDLLLNPTVLFDTADKIAKKADNSTDPVYAQGMTRTALQLITTVARSQLTQ